MTNFEVKLVEEVSLIVGGHHATEMFSADEVIMLVEEAITTVRKQEPKETK